MDGTEYIPDILERGEAQIERYCLPDGRIECCNCKAAVEPDDVVPADGSPYALPLCPACADEAGIFY